MTPPDGDRIPSFHLLEEWTSGHPGLVAGITAVADGGEAGSGSDYGLTTGGDAASVERRYVRLAQAVGLSGAAVGRQVHGVTVHAVSSPDPGRLRVFGDVDGLVTDAAGVLLVVTAADCVPVFMADESLRCVGMVHAGWRGAAAGILERGLSRMERTYGVHRDSVRVHLGPAICGDCYEVGPEVLSAFGRAGEGPARLDLRAELERRAVSAGVAPQAVTRSGWCTRCGPVTLHSHRASGGRAGRMAAFAGLLPAGVGVREGRELRT